MIIREGENADSGVELTGFTAKSPEFTATTLSAYVPEGSYDTLAPAEEPTSPSAEVVPPSQCVQYNPNAIKVQSDKKNNTPSAYVLKRSYDTIAPAEEPTSPTAEVVPQSQHVQYNPNTVKVLCVCRNYMLNILVKMYYASNMILLCMKKLLC